MTALINLSFLTTFWSSNDEVDGEGRDGRDSEREKGDQKRERHGLETLIRERRMNREEEGEDEEQERKYNRKEKKGNEGSVY